MRKTTKDRLYDLARIIASDYNVKDLVGSNEFTEIAFHENEENDVELSRELITKYEAELKRITLRIENDIIEQLEEEPLDAFIDNFAKEQQEVEDISYLFTQEQKTLIGVINFYSDGTFEKITPKKEKPINPVRVPEYTMFAEGEDGYIILKGKYVGKLIHQINEEAGFDTAAAGWAKYMLEKDKNLTDDDRSVLNRMVKNQL